jgi:hypothetical protein
MMAKHLLETVFKTKKDFGNPQKERLREPPKRKTGTLKKKDCVNPPNDEEVLLELRGLPK